MFINLRVHNVQCAYNAPHKKCPRAQAKNIHISYRSYFRAFGV